MQTLEIQANSFLVTIFFFWYEKQSLSHITHDASQPKTSAICYVPRLSQSTRLFKEGRKRTLIYQNPHTHKFVGTPLVLTRCTEPHAEGSCGSANHVEDLQDPGICEDVICWLCDFQP